MRLEVWSPSARRVEVVMEDGERLALASEARGMHASDDPRLFPGLRYRISLDGGQPRPDPRSRLQPEGVHGASQLVDLDDYAWTDSGWSAPPLAESVLYEVHIGTFTTLGTFDAAIERLDHLLDLGVTALEVMPIAEFPGRRGWGYDGVDLFAAHHGYGGPDGFRRLVDACHRRGLAVVLDVVYNHLGPDGNYLGEFGPYFTDRYRTPWGEALNYDGAGSDGVRDFVVDNAVQWLRDYHVDGLRLDACHAIFDCGALPILEELAEQVEALEAGLGRRLWLIAETDRSDPRTVRPRDQGGWGIDAQWADDFHHALHVSLTGERSGYYEDYRGVDDLLTVLRSPYVYTGQYSAHRDRRHGRSPRGLGGEHFVVATQNHDQVGNRAQGERLSHLVSPAALRVAAALLLTSPYVPMLFAGEEWAASTPFQYFTEHNPELGRLVTEGRRREFASFGWPENEVPDPQAEATLAASRLRWDEVQAPGHRQLLDWYRRLIRLRRSEPDLGCGDPAQVRVSGDPVAGWLVVERGRHLITANLSEDPVLVPAPGVEVAAPRLSSCPGTRAQRDSVSLPGKAVAVWRRR